jgi:hypothetical protein
MLRRVALVRSDVSEEPSPSIRVTRIGELGTTQAATSNRRTHLVFLRSVRRLLVATCVVSSSPILVTLMEEALGFSETSGLTRATRRNIPEDTILHSIGMVHFLTERHGVCKGRFLPKNGYMNGEQPADDVRIQWMYSGWARAWKSLYSIRVLWVIQLPPHITVRLRRNKNFCRTLRLIKNCWSLHIRPVWGCRRSVTKNFGRPKIRFG